jgi:hypothetical protein
MMDKKKVDQTQFSSEDGTVNGNCFSACLAMLFDIPIDGIPNFAEMGTDWFNPFLRFINNHGYDYYGMIYMLPFREHPAKTWEDVYKRSPGVDGFYIVGGPSPRTYVKNGHAVLYKDGKMWHDPHPSRDGLLAVQDVYMIERKREL